MIILLLTGETANPSRITQLRLKSDRTQAFLQQYTNVRKIMRFGIAKATVDYFRRMITDLADYSRFNHRVIAAVKHVN